MIRESPSLMTWLQEMGVRFQPALTGTLSLGRTNAFFLGGGKALVNALYRTAERLGVRVFYDTSVRALEIERGRVSSAELERGDEIATLASRAVVLASGGFQGNAEWMREAWGEAADNFLIRGTPHNTGLMLKSLIAHDAETVGEPTQCHAVAIDARGPKYDGGIVTRLDCVCFSIVVNQHGRRFYDEGEDFWPKRYAIWGRLVAQQPGQIAYAIIDDKVAEQFMPSVFPPIVAGSLSALAGQIGIEPEDLERTVTGFNEAVRPGRYDPHALDGCATSGLTPDKTNWALPIDTPPYQAYPLRPGVTFTYLGAMVDEQARVQFQNLGGSPNVFAAGEMMAGNILGQGYCAGTGMTIGGVFGRLAGQHAAAAAGYTTT